MAYYQNYQEDPYKNQSNAQAGSSGGGLLGAPSSPGNGLVAGGTQPAAPAGGRTGSGMRFANLSRYLEQNPSWDPGSQISKYAGDTMADEKSNYDNQIRPAQGYVNKYGPGLNKDYSDDEILDAADSIGDMGPNSASPTRELVPKPNILTGSGMTPPPEIKYTPGEKFKKLGAILQSPYAGKTPGKPYSLMTESGLVKNAPSYTSGMEALDLGLAKASPTTNSTISKLQGDATKAAADYTSGANSWNTQAGAVAKGMADKQQRAVARAKALFDAKAPDAHGDAGTKFVKLAQALGMDPGTVGKNPALKAGTATAVDKGYINPFEDKDFRDAVADTETAPMNNPWAAEDNMTKALGMDDRLRQLSKNLGLGYIDPKNPNNPAEFIPGMRRSKY